MQPPWSIEMSTMTEPGFIARTNWRRTSFGAAAPGTSTAPIRRSAETTSRSMFSTVENSVCSCEPNCMSSSYRRGSERSMTVTCASRPIAIRAALVPETPPPKMTTLAAATPGTPPSRIPSPPRPSSRQCAPTCTDLRPGRFVCAVIKADASTGAGLDHDLVPVMHQFAHAARDEPDAVFVALHLFRHADQHHGTFRAQYGSRPHRPKSFVLRDLGIASPAATL